MLRVSLLSEFAKVPTRGSDQAAGYDLYSAVDQTIDRWNNSLIRTDIAIEVPEGTYGRIAPRSGLALKHRLDVGAGVVDRDYRGNVGVVLFNLSDTPYNVRRGDKVAQLVLEQIRTPEIQVVDSLDQTDRGEGGFGSTGK